MALSPMMQHYVATKEQYKDCILFYRLGDFYEMFFDDAVTVSKELELTLTGKDCGLSERAPMCGIPYHAAEVYVNRLIEKGHKVAICEQMEDPKTAKGIVKRAVIRVVTPGTTMSLTELDETKNNYICCVACTDENYGLAIADISTGDAKVTQIEDTQKLADEIFKLSPSELICNQAFTLSGIDGEALKSKLHLAISTLDDRYFDDEICKKVLKEHFHVASPDALGLSESDLGIAAAGALFQYLFETQKSDMAHMTRITPYVTDKYMLIDASSRRNLELTETLREKQKKGSLLWVLDKTKTAMGARMLRMFVEQPLTDKGEIERRLDAVEALGDQPMIRDEIREYLGPVYDLERLISRISYQSANPRDLIAFKSSLQMLPFIRQLLSSFDDALLGTLMQDLDPLEDLYTLLEGSIVEDPPLAMKEGGIIKDGYDKEVDNYRQAKQKGKSWLSELESSEREKTGIRNLKVKYNKVFGYYLEVTNSFLDKVPDYYTRKQTLTNAERYITPRLKELEDMILGAEDKLYALEYEKFADIRDRIGSEVVRIQKTARTLAALDVFASLSIVAARNNFTKPKINTKGIISIKGGRHPVVEQMIQNDLFIENDTYLDTNEHRLSVITGPNMAGKSTYMRQSALIVLMAQLGSFVPAASADIGLVDRIFTRVGASDDLASGQSTFMVEMTEVANILLHATPRSLLILDEIGRGTSTFDGLAIAWAVIEYVADKKRIGAKTLFATHYHELTELEGKISGVHNYCIAVKEKGDDIVFLRKIIKGGADKSYGIQVARLAGVPDTVLARAKELVEELSKADITEAVRAITDCGKHKKGAVYYDEVDMQQMSLFDTMRSDDIVEEIEGMDLSNITPIEALNTLYNLQGKVKNRWKN